MNRKLFTSTPKSRREFIKATAMAAGAITFGMPALVRGRDLNSKVNIASIGVGGKGKSDTEACAGENVVAICDVDKSRCTELLTKFPDAKFYEDFRKMFDDLGKS